MRKWNGAWFAVRGERVEVPLKPDRESGVSRILRSPAIEGEHNTLSQVSQLSAKARSVRVLKQLRLRRIDWGLDLNQFTFSPQLPASRIDAVALSLAKHDIDASFDQGITKFVDFVG